MALILKIIKWIILIPCYAIVWAVKGLAYIIIEILMLPVKLLRYVLFGPKGAETDGLEFEYTCAKILKAKGFRHVKVTKGSGDQGADIIAYKHFKKYAVQCKLYDKPVGNKAVQEVYAAKAFYECDRAMVMTNNTFTKGAKDISEVTGVELWDNVPTKAPYSYKGVIAVLLALAALAGFFCAYYNRYNYLAIIAAAVFTIILIIVLVEDKSKIL